MGVWLGLIAGNSKLHWAEFEGNCLVKTWDAPHLPQPLPQLGPEFSEATPLYFASVVPEQSQLIAAAYRQAREVTLTDLPLENLYPTLGIDRALALLGAGDRYGYPILVIDGGTAITLTGADSARKLVGGAILPGLQLQFDSLGLGTAALPRLDIATTAGSKKPSAAERPTRWALNTEDAITSGILHSLANGLRGFANDWLKQYPQSAIVTTGGSGPWIATQLAEIQQVQDGASALGLFGILAWLQQPGEETA